MLQPDGDEQIALEGFERPNPKTLNPTPKPQTLNPKSLNPKPQIPNPNPISIKIDLEGV